MEFSTWIVSSDEKQLFDQIFDTLDIDNDGYIIGTDDCVRKIFLKTQLQHTVLAHIWNLCDIKLNGKLNSEQFALAMHFVNEAKKGNELPTALTPEMIPPTLRPKPKSGLEHQESSKVLEANKFSNKELEFLAQEVKELESEKHNLEHEVCQQETHLKLKESEIKSIKNEIETMFQMIKQLENQKVEAAKRLDEMEHQTVTLRKQNEEQKKLNEIEEAELKVKKDEFEGLKSEEQQYETKVNELKKEIDKISAEIAESQLLVCKYKTKAIGLEEYENHLNEENKEFDICIASKDVHRLNALIAKQLQPPEGVNAIKQANGFGDNAEFPSFTANEFAADPFAGEDPFANDAFANAFSKSNTDEFIDDPFSAKSGFNQTESTPQLPPKKSGPPIRPPPPKASKPQPKNQQTDPWGNTINDPFAASNQTAGSDNFADFANFDQPFASSNQSDAFSSSKSDAFSSSKSNNSFDPFADFNNKFDDKFEANWSQFSNSNQTDDPFSSVQKPSPIYQFLDANEDKKRKEKQIKDDYELALKLSQNDNFSKRKF